MSEDVSKFEALAGERRLLITTEEANRRALDLLGKEWNIVVGENVRINEVFVNPTHFGFIGERENGERVTYVRTKEEYPDRYAQTESFLELL